MHNARTASTTQSVESVAGTFGPDGQTNKGQTVMNLDERTLELTFQSTGSCSFCTFPMFWAFLCSFELFWAYWQKFYRITRCRICCRQLCVQTDMSRWTDRRTRGALCWSTPNWLYICKWLLKHLHVLCLFTLFWAYTKYENLCCAKYIVPILLLNFAIASQPMSYRQ